jgi:hypothetical protein
MSSKLSKAINRIAPDAQFVIRGENIEWHSENYPTQEEINLSLLAIDAEKYKEKRAAEYPPITDYIDGIVKGDNAQVQAYIDACQVVKAKYPKGNN